MKYSFSKKQENSLEKMNAAIVREIRIGMAQSGIRNYTELAKMIKMPASTFYEHVKHPLDYPLRDLHLIALAVGRPLSEMVAVLETRRT